MNGSKGVPEQGYCRFYLGLIDFNILACACKGFVPHCFLNDLNRHICVMEFCYEPASGVVK